MSEPIAITVDSVKQGLTALVESVGRGFAYTPRGVGVNKRCVYVYNGEPDCIVGRFLAGAGVPVERLERADLGQHGTPGLAAAQLLLALEDEGVITVEPHVELILSEVQGYQDLEHRWSEVVRGVLANH